MGDTIRVTCSQCNIDREEFVGVGMLAEGQELCSCYQCERLVLKKYRWKNDFDLKAVKCPVCKANVEPVHNETPCPLCGGRLQVEITGNWD